MRSAVRRPGTLCRLALSWCLLDAAALALAGRAEAPALEASTPRHHSLVQEAPDGSVNVSAAFREDLGRISVLELAGDYDLETEGALNVAARAAVAGAFLTSHDDAYDFLVAFTRFPFDFGGAGGYHWLVRNDVEGIGLPLYDQTSSFGSDGFLRGYSDMGRLADLGSEPGTVEFEETLTVLLHELFHQWAAYARVDDGGGPIGALLGLDASHWSFLLDTQGSVLYGNRWRDNADGTFTSTAVERVLSPLDLYLAGLVPPEEVPPFTLLASPSVDPDRLPELGATIAATPDLLTVDAVIAAEGARVPSADSAPREFQAAFLYVVRPGDVVSTEELAALERIRQGLLLRFTAATGALATLEVHPAATQGGGGGPGTIGGGDLRGGPASVADALAWLRDRQQADGSWLDVPSTQVRDTSTALGVLSRLDPTFDGTTAHAWLDAALSPSTDHLAWQIDALASQGESVADLLDELATRQNLDGGWGLSAGLDSEPLDTGLALLALLGAAPAGSSTAVQAGTAYLVECQNPDGGWGPAAGGESRIRSTAVSLRALSAVGEMDAVDDGLQWLLARQNPDGGFGDSPSSAHQTAEALETLFELHALQLLPDAGASAGAYLESRQDVAGSWEGSVFTTSLVAQALQRLSHPNWHFVGQPSVTPESPLDGQQAVVPLEVANDGNLPTPVGLLQLFDGDPSAAGVLADEALLAALAPGEALVHELSWDTSGSAGMHQLVAILDPLDQVAELTELDNRVEIPVVVEPAPEGVELALRQSELVVTPTAPDHLPTQILVQSVLRNLGQTAATDVTVALSVGDPGQPTAEIRATVSVPARSSAPVSILYDLQVPGTTELRLIADPDDLVAEADETNNQVTATVMTVPSFDLEVLASDLELLDGPARLGQDVTFRVRLRNRGTSDAPSVTVEPAVTDGSQTRSLPPLQLQLDAGEEAQRDIPWRVDLTGTLTFGVTMDPGNQVPEIDESNNAAAFEFESTAFSEPNLTVSAPDLQVDPDPALEGVQATLSALVRNTGGTPAGEFAVRFHDGAPTPGGSAIGTVTVPSLAAGAALPVDLVWSEVPDDSERFLHVVVDANAAIEEASEEDNQAFRPLAVLGLPDAVVASAGLRFDPPLPAPGQPVALTVEIANLGEQDLTDLLVRAWEGDPAAGGVPVGGDQVVPSIPGQTTGEAVLVWTLGTAPGVRTIHVEVDPDGTIREAEESNNSAEASLGVQEGDAFVSEPFFSPDGDGTRDTTTLFFSLEEPQDVEVQVVDRARDRLVRIFGGSELENVESGQVTWNGRDGEGRLVRDAEYVLRVVGSNGAVEGEALATLDTNRSSLLLAIGTEYEHLTNLTCEVGSQQFDLRVPRTEDYAYFIVEATSNPVYPKGIFRRALPFGALEEIVPASWIGNRGLDSLAVSPDGRRVAFRLQVGASYELWFANADGSGLTELPLDFNPLFPEEDDLGRPYVFGFGPGSGSLLVAGTWGFIAEYSLTEPGLPQRWWPVSAFYQPADVTADGTRLALADAWDDGTIVLIDLETGAQRELLRHSDYGYAAYPRWSPDGRTLAVTSYEHQGLYLFDREGDPLGSVPLPVDGTPQFQRFYTPQWRGDGSETLVTGNHSGCRTVDLVDVQSLSHENLTASCENWPPEGDAFDPSLELVMPPGDMVWDPNDRSVMRDLAWTSNDDQVALFFDEGFREEPFLEGWRADSFRFSPHGRHMVFWSNLTGADPEANCWDSSDWWALTSLQNLTVDLQVRVPPGGGYLLEGTAIDVNFDRYRLEWRELGDPAGWHPVSPAVETIVLDGYLGTWVPPGPGTYQLRLTAFDLAGNRLSRVRQVSTSSTPDITDVVVAPPLISPNGDGVLDTLSIEYRVLRPVNLEVRIFDAGGLLVRTYSQSHPVAGEQVSLLWDGRSDDGLRVADGDYRVLVQQYEFFTAVDATPPQLGEPGLHVILEAPQPPGDRAHLRLLVAAGAADEHLLDLELQRGLGALPSAWEHQPAHCEWASGGMAVGCEARVEVERFVGHSFRVLAEDRAGNATVVASPLAPEAFRITGFGRHAADPVSGDLLPLEPTHGGASLTIEHGPVRFALTEAVREELTQVLLQYRHSGTGEPWTELPVDELRDPVTGEVVPWIPQPRFEVVWGLEELPPGESWSLRLRALAADGTEHLTQSVGLSTDGLLFRGYVAPWSIPGEVAPLVTEAELDPAEDLLLWAEEYVGPPLERATLYVLSDDDPRYETVRAFEPVASAEGVLLWRLVEWQSCSTYTAWVEVVVEPVPGTPARTLTSSTRTVELPCLDLTFEIEPVLSDGCDSGPDESRLVTLRPRSLDGSALQLLSLFGPDEEGEEDLLFTVNQPESDAEYSWALDLADVPEGSYPLRAALTNVPGEQVGGVPRSASAAVSESGRVIVDREAPSAVITFPPPGELVCPTSATHPGTLDVLGTIDDDLGAAHLLEWGLGPSPIEWHPAWTSGEEGHPIGTLLNDRDGTLGPPGGLYSRAASGKWSKELSVPPRSGLLDRIGEVSGEITARLQAADSGGSHVCSAPTTFTLDALLVGASLAAGHALFSPDGDGTLDSVTVTVGAAEPTTVGVWVRPGVLTPDGPAFTGPVARVLATGLAVSSSTTLLWDGLDDAGQVVADDSYVVLAELSDGCANTDWKATAVEVDTTAPDLAIVSPTPSTPLPMIVTVTGTADDPHFFGWSLSFGEGPSPQGWFPLASGEQSAPSPEALGTWNTFGLAGIHTLRLVADDRAGNRAEATVTLDLEDRTYLVDSLIAEPPLFSPNGDGRREETLLQFGLQFPCSIVLGVVDEQEVEVARLIDGDDLPEGGHAISWDGGAIPDGEYRARIEARLTADPTVLQLEEVPIVVDRTAPSVLVDRPAEDGWMASSDPVHGTIADEHLDRWSVSIASPPGSAQWQELSSGTAPVTDGPLADLGDLPEGAYALRVFAEDRAEIRSEAVVAFGIDDTAPVATMTAPQAEAFVGGPTSPVAIEGEAGDDHLEGWSLELGSGSPAATWTPLEGSTEPAAGTLLLWDATSAPDGPSVLRLSARDLAGNEDSSEVPVTVDNTPPVAEVVSPAAGSFVGDPGPVTGTVSDANLLVYTVSVVRPDGVVVAQLAEGDEPVSDGTLAQWTLLPPDGEYELRVTARDRVDHRTTASVPVTVDAHPPATPTGLAVALIGGDDAALTWDANGEPDLAGYRVFRDGAPLVAEPIADTAWLDEDLTPGTYLYTVTAVDLAGQESDPAGPVSLSLDTTPPLVEIHSPLDGEAVAGLVDVLGTAWSAEDFARYRVLARPAGGGASLLVRESTVPIQASLLGQWDTSAAPEGSAWVLRLEAEDLGGNQAAIEVAVLVDNAPPAAPTGLTAAVAGPDVHLTWSANVEPDLLGYLLYRDDELVNAGGPVIGDLRPYALTSTQYDDLSLPDGEHEYVVYALDEAGNSSPPSAPAVAVVETGPPHAVLVEPEDGSSFEAPAYLLAEVDAQDVATVQFQYRRSAEPAWSDLGTAATDAPYDTILDPTATTPPLEHGEHQLRAVATDTSGATDPDPVVIAVTYTDLTPPDPPSDLAASVDGGTVALSWSPVDTPDLDGYLVYRIDGAGTEIQVNGTPVGDPSLTDPDLADDEYSYAVSAVDIDGNESDRSPPVAALVYTPWVAQPLTPRLATTVDLEGSARPQTQVSGELSAPSGVLLLPEIAADGEGRFTFEGLALEPGRNEIRVRATDPAGNRSKDALVPLDVGSPPGPPTGLSATVLDLDVELSWNANLEPAILGYRPTRDAVALLPDEPVTGLSASASSEWQPAAHAVDGDPGTAWRPSGSPEGQWIELSRSPPQVVTTVTVDWYVPGAGQAYSAESFRLETWSGEVWVPVSTVEGNELPTNVLPLPQPYRTDRLRLVLGPGGTVALAEVRVDHRPVVPATSFVDPAGDGTFEYAVTAMDSFAFESPPSEPVEVSVGDVEPPDPVVLAAEVFGSDVELSWSASPSPDVVAYEIIRDGEIIALHTDLGSLLFLDPGLVNGTYTYLARAVDAAGNRSADSNPAVAVVAIPVLEPPEDLQATPLPAGRRVLLAWTPGPGAPPAGYRLLRSLASGGPWELAVTTTATTVEDGDLENGTPYYWVVLALDEIGNASLPSNEATATPFDAEAPTAPTLHYPTLSGRPAVVPAATSALAATAEPGAAVTFRRDGEVVGGAPAIPADEVLWGADLDGPELRLAPDGARLWGTVWDVEADDWSWRLLAFDGSPVEVVDRHADRARWSHDGSDLVYAEAGRIHAWDVKHRSERLLASADEVRAVEPSPDGTALAVVGRRDGSGYRLWQVALEGEVWTDLTGAHWGSPIAWSPDGTRLAFSDGGWRLHEIATGIEVALPPDVSGVPSWAPDGARLLLPRTLAGDRQIWSYDLASGEVVRLTNDPDGAAWPRWAPDGSSFAYLSGTSELLLASPDGEPLRPLLDLAAPCAPCDLQWTGGGALFAYTRGGLEWLRLVPEGTAALASAPLVPGENRFRATATDAAGNESAESDEIVVVRSASGLPDLVLATGDLQVVPAGPLEGSTALFSVTVRNTGDTMAPRPEVSALVLAPDGSAAPLFESQELADIAPGGAETLTAELALPGPSGAHRLIATADPRDLLLEADEENNLASRLFPVVPSAEPTLSATTDRPAYGAFEIVHGEATLLHGGPTFDGRLLVAIVDGGGQPVVGLLDTAVHLEGGTILELPVTWPTGQTWAGPYRLAAELVDDAGTLRAAAAVDFEITEQMEVEADVGAGQPLYQVGDPVQVLSEISYLSGNALLDGSTLEVSLGDPAGLPLETWSTTPGTLLPGDSVQVASWWNSGGHSAGQYRLELTLRRSGLILASAVATFELDQASLQVLGDLELSNPSPPLGEGVEAAFEIVNLGEEVLAAVPIRLRLVEPMTGVALQLGELLLDLPSGTPVTGEIGFETLGLETIPYVILLQAELEDEAGTSSEVNLAAETLLPADGAAPTLIILRPQEAELLGVSSLFALLEASDPTNQLTAVECRVDGGEWAAAVPLDPTTGTYSCDLAFLTEGTHSLEARAHDEAGNTTTEGPVAFEVDLTPPSIEVLGVADGEVYTEPVTPEIVVVEAHPVTEVVLLDGQPFVSGTPVDDPGDHLLEVEASDAAGNLAEAAVHFTLLPDGEPLELIVNTVNDVDDGQCGPEHCSLREAIQVANLDGSAATIRFDIPGTGTLRIIEVRSALPAIVTPVEVDGLSQPGAACDGPPAPAIVLDGSRLTTSTDGLVVAATDVVLRGLAVVRFPGNGLRLSGGGRHLVECSRIGNLDSEDAATGNAANGLLLEAGVADSRIGSDSCPVPCNVIAFNREGGAAMAPTASGGNEIRGNTLFRNGGLGIDLGTDGLTLNDELDGDGGPNGLQNYPEVIAVRPGGASEVDVELHSTPESDFAIELFRVDTINGDQDGVRTPPPFGEADHLVAHAQLSTDADGLGSVTVPVAADLSTAAVTATATDLATGDTSELGAAFVAHFTHSIVAGLRAVGDGHGRGFVEWRTASESGVLGFRLFRQPSTLAPSSGEWTEVTDQAILALRDSPEGALYRVAAEAIAPGDRLRLLLVEEGTRGNRRLYGPFLVPVEEWSTGRDEMPEPSPRREPLTKTQEPAPGEASIAAGSGAAGTVAKIGIRETGLHRVGAQQLAAALGLEETVVRSLLAARQGRLEVAGLPVDWLAESDGSALYFYGVGPADPYSPFNVYWLDLDVVTEAGTYSGLSPAPEPGGHFTSVATFTEDLIAATNLAIDPDADFWFWKAVVATQSTGQSIPFELIDPAPPGTGTAELRLTLYAPPTAGAAEGRTVAARINGSPVGEIEWQGWGWIEASFAFSDSLLAGSNDLEVSAFAPSGSSLAFFYLDGFSVAYPRAFTAHEGRLLVTGEAASTLTVEGLPTAEPWVLDLSGARSMARVTDVTVVGSDPWSASWVPAPDADRFWVGDRLGASLAPEWVVAESPTRLLDGRNAADLLAISTPALLDALEPLLARREAEGLLVARVDVQDLYDELNHGLASPRALEAFLEHVAAVWAIAPRYVLLGGAGTFDYRDHLGAGGNPVPPLLERTPDGLFATDLALGDVSGDDAPELAVGRVPARTPEEMEAYVAKVLAYEASAGAWADRLLLLADGSDGVAGFGADTLTLLETLPGGEGATLLLRDELGLAEIRQQLFAAIQSGAGLLHYLGHGGVGQLGQQPILTTSDVGGLANAPALPVVIAPTCVANRHELPTVASLGEALVLEPDGGAAAVFSATGLSQHGSALRFSREWLKRPWPSPSGERLGDLILEALREATAAGAPPEAFRTYTLLGDPTLRAPVAPP